MKMEVVTQVYKTCDYEGFKVLQANRDVDNKRINTIKKSFEKIGYVINPVIVNEKYEVIDGQGRLAVCKEMNIPVYFVIVEGIGISECREMNKGMKNWTTKDYIKSYADDGKESYIMLNHLINKYKNLPHRMVSGLACGVTTANTEFIVSGKFACTEEAFKETDELCEYLTKFTEYVNKTKGYGERLYSAIAWLVKLDLVEKEKMLEQYKDYYSTMPPIATQIQAIQELETIYNYRKRQKVFFVSEYKKLMTQRNCFGEKSWSLKQYNESE